MNYYEQLRTLLCEVPEIKKDLKIKLSIIWDCNMYSAWTDYRDIEERHIRIYCRNKLLNLIINSWWEIATQDKDLIIELDNSKPFHLQDEQVYKQLVEYFKWLKD